ncbi:mutanase [Aspergillus aculeatinus CBS 121060]|uniref:Mutanase n=1 Tax=Aspergillus aculeatinus CBS 121060 TaxID=1448322 RepID=A0ACD1H9Y3_9EURO|nr:mutanase [Aspergillus aculeatinus CBS 121060]RAH70323.1 mutanase [Aspergillus aculeatinus CBS 121060]
MLHLFSSCLAMRLAFPLALALWLTTSHVHAAAIFAHFMVGNVPTWTVDDWRHDIQLAQAAHIDAFALNIANGWFANEDTLAVAFEAAATDGFKLFFSFDYAGNGSWAEADVISLIKKYKLHGGYYTTEKNGAPLVSTFEGPDSAADWANIRDETGCFFVPDWSSVGAIPASEEADGVVDGLFSWASWPWGNLNMMTFVDASYIETLNSSSKPYMMPVSPWFYTNMPGYDENWMWRGDDTWYQRWVQIWYLQPEFVEIISWNDFGESHYIGPLDNRSYSPFTTGRAPFNYVEHMPQDGWRELLPFMIDTYKNGRALVTEEKIVMWHRTSLVDDCDRDDTTANTASQLQAELLPNEVAQDRLFFTALLASNADVVVEYNNPSSTGFRGPGLYRGSVSLKHAAEVNLKIGRINFNAYVAASEAIEVEHVYANFNLTELSCIAGYSADAFTELCEFTCAWGYCPVGACVCTNLGVIQTVPNATGQVGYPANGDANYAGLCTFACNLGFCPSKYCAATLQASYIPTVSPFTPNACVAGMGEGSFAGLCSYACAFGFCPENHCTCTKTGALAPSPVVVNTTGVSLIGDDSDLYAAENFQNGDYYAHFFAEKVRTADFAAHAKAVYQRVATVLDGTAPYGLKLTCNFAHSECDRSVAHTKDSARSLNFCAGFFANSNNPDSNGNVILATDDRLQHCPTLNLRKANRSRAATIIHELTHTSFVMNGVNGGEKSKDYAYGILGCTELAQGRLDRSCTAWYRSKPSVILCPNTDAKESVCDADRSAWNAESWQSVASGVYFSAQCQRAIEISNDVPVVRRDTNCPTYDDYFIWDEDEQPVSVKGYVHFGDSFAAGMGTGSTSWVECRVGSNNYGKLLYNYLNDSSIPFANYACSGDTTTGLANQVKKWKDTSSFNLATLTLGGNDVGFSDIIRNCITWELPWGYTAMFQARCEEVKDKARSILSDTSSSGMRNKLKEAYLSILSASFNDDFMLYVTGYVGFFNYDTTICDLSTFNYWWPSYKALLPISDDVAFLKTAVRKELDDLVDQMNQVIPQAIKDANSAYGSTGVTYVDMQPSFDTHRFCEEGVYEPSPNRGETFFFLSGWDDYPHEHDELVTVEAETAAVEAAEVVQMMSLGSIPIPDAVTCNTTLGTDPDPYAVVMCDASLSVSMDPNGEVAQRLAQANADISSRNYSSTAIKWWLPTRQIKTFHPRSDGMFAFRDAVWTAIEANT